MKGKSRLFLDGFFLVSFLLFPITACSKSTMQQNCSEEWTAVELEATKNNWSVDEVINEWKRRKGKCDNHDFWHKLGKLHLLSDDYSAAEGVVRELSSSREGMDLALSLEHKKQKKSGKINYDYFVKGYSELAEKYPGWFEAYLNIAYYQLEKKEFSSAFKAARRSNQIMGNAFAFRIESVSSFQLKDYENSVTAAFRATTLDPGMKMDKEMMLGAAESCLNLEKFKAAEGILSQLVTANPKAANDEEFLRVYRQLSANL